MSYNEIMQEPGRRIDTKIYYYENEIKKEFGYNDIINAKLFFNSKLIGSVSKGLKVILKESLPFEKIYFSNTATYDRYSATKVYGPYYLKEMPKYNADDRSYEHTLFDSFILSMVDYEPLEIAFPCTVLDFFNKLCLTCGYTTNITNLPNGNRIMKSDVYKNINYTYRDVFDDIGIATATLFKINNNVVEKCVFGTEVVPIDDDLLKNKNISLENHFGPINSIILSRSGDSDKIYLRDETLTTWNEFEIKDNQLMNDNDRSDYLEELYAALNGIEYDVFDLELVGYGGFEPLDKIKIETGNKVNFSFVFNNEITFTQGVEECIYTELPEESIMDYKASSSTDKTLEQAFMIVDKQNKIITALANRVDSLLDYMKEITFTGDSLKLENTPASHGAINRLLISGFDLQNLYPNMTYPSAYTKTDKLNFYTLIFSNEEVVYSKKLPSADSTLENRVYNIGAIKGNYYRCVKEENSEIYKWVEATDLIYQEVYINSPIPLQGNDEILIENNNVKIIQKTNANGESLIYPRTYNLGTYTIPTFEGNTHITFKYFKNLSYECEYLMKNELTANFATQAETIAQFQIMANKIESMVSRAEFSTTISQTVNEINLKVSKKVNSDEIINAINLSDEQIENYYDKNQKEIKAIFLSIRFYL